MPEIKLPDTITCLEDIEKYQKLRKPISARLANYKVSQDGCWEWQGAKNRFGYGSLIIKGPNGLRQIGAHKLAYMMVNGPVPAGQNVLHTCDNRCCINPGHLYLGDQAQNMADMLARGRSALQKQAQEAKKRADALRHHEMPEALRNDPKARFWGH